jgi:hypothetical protein
MICYIYIYEETLIKKKKKELPMCSKDLDNPTYGLFKKLGRYRVSEVPLEKNDKNLYWNSYSQLALRIKYHDNPKSINFNMPISTYASRKQKRRKENFTHLYVK